MSAAVVSTSRTVSDAAASLARRLYPRSISDIEDTDAFVGDDSGAVVCCFLISGEWLAEAIDDDPSDPLDVLYRVMLEAERIREARPTLH